MSPLTKYVIETVVTLLAVIALAVLVLYGARRLGVGKPAGPVSLVGRLPLEGRRVIYLVRVGGRVYVIGGSEAGLAKLGELDDAEHAFQSESQSFKAVLARVVPRPAKADDGEAT
ncbi:MAG: flagellar biosynthetic protein FliO [Polyangiaceae bacterium]|nr:flagellar biosynthetic protein FliO [Polyangiaceae bacterium]